MKSGILIVLGVFFLQSSVWAQDLSLLCKSLSKGGAGFFDEFEVVVQNDEFQSLSVLENYIDLDGSVQLRRADIVNYDWQNRFSRYQLEGKDETNETFRFTLHKEARFGGGESIEQMILSKDGEKAKVLSTYLNDFDQGDWKVTFKEYSCVNFNLKPFPKGQFLQKKTFEIK